MENKILRLTTSSLFALLFNFRKPIIKKTAYAVLVLYTVFFDVCGTMLIGVASPVIWIAWVMIFLIVSNSALILYYCYLFETPYRDKNVVK